MPSIEFLTVRAEPASPWTTGGELLARFREEPGALAIAVVDGGRPLGLIERDDLLLKLATAEDRGRLARSTAVELMDPEPAIVEADVEQETFRALVTGGGHEDLRRGFIVTEKGRYVGVATGLCLVRAEVINVRAAEAAAPVVAIEQPTISEQTFLERETEVREAAARDKSRFLNVLSHELRTPLNGVLAVAEMLRRQPLNDTAHAHVQTIVDSADSLLRVIEDALDLARAEAGELELAPQPAALRSLMDEIQADWTPRASQDNVTLMVSYEGDTELAAEIDAPRLRQVFDTLIGHALKFARNGVVEAGLKATLEGDAVRIACRVRDDGPGVDAEAGAAFDTETHRSKTGRVDIGLSISRLIVERMGGVIRAENNQGRGATFAFETVAPGARLETEAGSNVADLSEFDLQASPHILIVDDNATNRVVAQALCEMFGCTSETAEDGVEAVEVVQQRPFDLILMDIKMPRMDGVQATQAIRALGGDIALTPIIALTANADPDDARTYLANGMAAVVEKPIKPERLRNAINAALAPEAESGAEASPFVRRSAN